MFEPMGKKFVSEPVPNSMVFPSSAVDSVASNVMLWYCSMVSGAERASVMGGVIVTVAILLQIQFIPETSAIVKKLIHAAMARVLRIFMV